MAKIYVGTSGYSYKDWIGPFYPDDTRENEFLPFYAARFSFVELNFSYYSMPRPELISRLIDKTPDHFLFSVKAHQSLTHELPRVSGKKPGDAGELARNAELFIRGIAPLAERKRLAAVLLQFPYSFHYTPENRSYLDAFIRRLPDLPLACEFRNSEWLKDQVRDGLAERKVSFVNLDQPDLSGLIRPSAIVTGDPAYLRFHGRNKADWWTGDNVSRYDYLYSDEELISWIEYIRSITEKVRVLLIAFNNHARGQAVQNARRLKELLLEQRMEVS